MKNSDKQSNKVPPDGGYGWVIVFANALSSFIVLSLLQCFGLIYKDTFSELELSATEGALIVNVNAAFGKMLGPLTGVLLKIFGCRKVAFLAGILFIVGMVFTSFAQSFAVFVIAYGIITSMGMQMSESTHRLAINLYFKKKRSLAMGFAVTAAGFGPILVPQLITLLFKYYTVQEVTLIYGGICTHIFIAAILLQPVKWHMKNDNTEVENVEGENFLEFKIEEDDLKKQTFCERIVDSFSKTFDLDLLKDPIFVNLLVGLSLATFSEINFTLLVPFILHDFGLTTEEIATFLSTLGVADLIFRFVAPYIGNYFTKPSKLMYTYAIIILTIVRFTLLISKNFYALLVIAFAWGIAKGVRKVYMWLVIPDYVSVEKLPSAGGMETLANGICILVGGPILGVLRDITGSYAICIIVMNCVSMLTIVLWTMESLIIKYKFKNSRPIIQ